MSNRAMNGPVLFSYALSGEASGRALEGAEIAAKLESGDLAWAHLDATDPATRSWVEQTLPYLDRHAIDALLAEETRPRASQIGNGVLLVLRSVNLSEGADPADMVSLRVWIDPERILSVRVRLVRAARDIEDRIKDGRGPENAGAFLALLVARLTERVEPVLRRLDDETDALEEGVVEHASPELRRPITEVRRRTIQLRRHLAPQRDAVSQLRTMPLDWIGDLDRRRLTESLDRLTRTVEDLDLIRERAQIVKDELSNSQAEKMNRNMYVLSVVAAIFLPLGFLTGLLGINVGGIPGSDNPLAFWVFLLALAVLVAAQVWLFRRFKLF